MKILLSLAFTFILYLFTFAQSATIKVIDAENKKFIAFANVSFESLNSCEKTYTTTNLNGIVNNTCTVKCIVEISIMGYKALRDTIYINQSLTYELEPDVFNLEQVTVTATRTEKHLKDAPVITQVIMAQDMKNRGLTNVQDVLTDDLPGLDFQQTGFGTNIQMQGLDAKYVLFLIDGERIAGEIGGNIDYSRLNTSNVDRIEVVKGAASALYGSQAMGGVINIITKKPKKKLELSAGSQYKQFNQVNYPDLKTTDPRFYYKQNLDRPNLNNNVSIGINLNKFSSQTDFIIKSFDAYKVYDKKPFAKEYLNADTIIYIPVDSLSIDGFEDYSVSQKLEYKISNKLIVGLKGSYYNHNQYSFSTTGSYKNYSDYTYGANITYKLSEKSSLLASYYSDTYSKNKMNENTKELIKNEYSNRFNTARVVYNIVYKKNSITAGTEFTGENLSSDRFVLDSDKIEERKSESYVFFAQDDINIYEKINFIVGARAEIHSIFGFRLTPKVSAMYKAKKFTYRFNYANGYRSPGLKELYMNWDHLGMFDIIGNEDLIPEVNNYFSLATELSSNKINTSITIYHNRFKNKIELVEENAETYKYINFDYSNISGIEVYAKYRVLTGLSISGGYSFINEDYTGKLIRVSAVSPHSGNVRFEYKFEKGWYNIIFNLIGKFYGTKSYTSGENIIYKGDEIYAEYNTRIPQYSMWKLSISQKLFNSVNIILGVDNIFNYTAEIVSYSSNLTPGRRSFIGIDISLDKFYDFLKTK